MAVVELIPPVDPYGADERPYLELVRSAPRQQFRVGTRTLAQRRASRARMMQRRRRVLVALALVVGLVILAQPGHAFGGVTGTGLPTDLANSSVLASGMLYVVQPGDTIDTIARLANPVDPSLARAALAHELGSSVVVAGEHVLVP